jgi:hypothetical protein
MGLLSWRRRNALADQGLAGMVLWWLRYESYHRVVNVFRKQKTGDTGAAIDRGVSSDYEGTLSS